MKQSLEEHRIIVEAIQSRDVQGARQAAQEHIENAENSMIESIKKDGFPTA
jgi:DNA-binding GntR family transcriptional regulator